MCVLVSSTMHEHLQLKERVFHWVGMPGRMCRPRFLWQQSAATLTSPSPAAHTVWHPPATQWESERVCVNTKGLKWETQGSAWLSRNIIRLESLHTIVKMVCLTAVLVIPARVDHLLCHKNNPKIWFCRESTAAVLKIWPMLRPLNFLVILIFQLLNVPGSVKLGLFVKPVRLRQTRGRKGLPSAERRLVRSVQKAGLWWIRVCSHSGATIHSPMCSERLLFKKTLQLPMLC